MYSRSPSSEWAKVREGVASWRALLLLMADICRVPAPLPPYANEEDAGGQEST